MQFGLFGSAQARRDGPNDDSGAGFREFVERNVEAEALLVLRQTPGSDAMGHPGQVAASETCVEKSFESW